MKFINDYKQHEHVTTPINMYHKVEPWYEWFNSVKDNQK